MRLSSLRGWALLLAFFAVLVLVSWQVFGRPLGQTTVSAAIGLIVGIAVVRLRARGGTRR